MSETPSPEAPGTEAPAPGPDTPRAPAHPVDVAVAASTLALGAAVGVARWTAEVLRPALRPALDVALRPPLVPESLQPHTLLDSLGRSGTAQRETLRDAVRQHLSDVLDTLVPLVVTEVVRRVDLTSLVLTHVDLEAIVARVDPDPVAERVDLDAIVERLDLTRIVLEKVDLEAVVTAAIDQIDLVALASDVIDGVDLPSIIRESSGAMASDTVRGVRAQGIAADEAIGRAVDRLLLRRTGRSTGEEDRA